MRNTYATGIYTGKRHEKKDFRGAKAGVDVKKDICRRKFCMAGVQEQEERHMKLKDIFITHDSDGEQVLIDVTSSFAGLVRSNKTAAFIVECLKTDTTKEQIVAAMYEKYDAPKDVLQKDVESIVEKLRGIGAIEE